MMRIEELESDKTLGRRFCLLEEDRPLLEFGLIVYGYIAQKYALWIALRDFEVSDARKVKAFLDERAKGLDLFCNVECGQAKARRFAKFFGFREVAVAGDRIVMEYS